jgi:hypothetical protein
LQPGEGFEPEPSFSLGEIGDTDESTCIDEINPRASADRRGDGGTWVEGPDILDLELSRYIPGFRDEYFLVEVKDMWIKRFRAPSADALDDRFMKGLSVLDGVEDSQVETIEATLIDSMVGVQRCVLSVGIRVKLRGSALQYRQELQETWTFVCEPHKDAVMRVVSIEQVTSE